ERLARIEGRLRQIEYQQDAPPVLDVVIKSMAPQRVVSQRLEASVSVIPAVRSRLEDHLLQGGVRNAAALPYWVLWHTCEQCDETIDLEIAYPVPDDFET
ncbi:MAG TPA: hypothetical protein PK954_12675, partial [Anaerolineales bacterium]|nr:hypothetical protein [Anaerolineales bacterium]